MEWKSVSRAAAIEWIYSVYRDIWDVRGKIDKSNNLRCIFFVEFNIKPLIKMDDRNSKQRDISTTA
jgi:hypothetical protein